MNYTKNEIADHLDLAVLQPTASRENIKAACATANKYKIKSVCVPLIYTPLACSLFDNISTVISFPHGNTFPEIKIEEARCALLHGAQELDVVINYGRFLEGDYKIIERELCAIVKEAQRFNALTKAILETHYYNTKQIIQACELCVDCGVDFVKTSTGFAPAGANKTEILLMKQALFGTGVELKASGGIASYADACFYLNAGCARIGASNFFRLIP